MPKINPTLPPELWNMVVEWVDADSTHHTESYAGLVALEEAGVRGVRDLPSGDRLARRQVMYESMAKDGPEVKEEEGGKQLSYPQSWLQVQHEGDRKGQALMTRQATRAVMAATPMPWAANPFRAYESCAVGLGPEATPSSEGFSTWCRSLSGAGSAVRLSLSGPWLTLAHVDELLDVLCSESMFPPKLASLELDIELDEKRVETLCDLIATHQGHRWQRLAIRLESEAEEAGERVLRQAIALRNEAMPAYDPLVDSAAPVKLCLERLA